MIKEVLVDDRITRKRDYYVDVENLQELLDSLNAVIYYKMAFYERVEDVPFEVERERICRYGFATNSYITMTPYITIVPKGTTIYVKPWSGSDEFVFPK